jgi:ribosomal protein S27AE
MEIQLIQNQNHFPVEIGYCINWINNPNKKETYALQCPNCNRAFCLANHTILNGIVMPSVVCPFNCGYHVMMTIKL